MTAPEQTPDLDAPAPAAGRGHIEVVASALRVQASRILELEAEVERLSSLSDDLRVDGLATECASLRAELDAIKGTRTWRYLERPRRVYGIVRRNRLDPRDWARDVRRRTRRAGQ